MVRKMYHTQENRGDCLVEPIECNRDDAWLGKAYYFWVNLDDAEMWGHKSKRATGWFDIYYSNIDCEDVLDTVFNEEHYNFWLKKVDEVAKKIAHKTKCRPTLKELNDYFFERGDWKEVTGILFQDLPGNEYYSLVLPILYEKKKVFFAYRKRIQLALYDKRVMINFARLQTRECDK